jgi:hypothetical protein
VEHIGHRHGIVVDVRQRFVSAIQHELVHLSSGLGGSAVQVGTMQGQLDGQHIAFNRSHTACKANLVLARKCERGIVESDVA